MWFLSNSSNGARFYITKTKKEYTIGKIASDFVIKGDSSISRAHAKLKLNNANTDQMQIILQDIGSKYGTFHNSQRLLKDANTILKPGDVIRFGVLNSIWTLSHMPIVCLTSTLSEGNVTTVSQCMKEIGGEIVNNWQPECTHLTMQELKITLKVLHALLERVSIVTCNYWQDVVQSVRDNVQLPEPQLYTPKCTELTLKNDIIDFKCWSERRKLFTNMTFVFMSKSQFEMYNPIIQKMSGECKELDKAIAKSFLIRDGVVVIQRVSTGQSQPSQSVQSIEEYLQAHKRRLIPEFEIGLAVVHCSKIKHCNPSYNIINDILPNELGNNNTPQSVLVPNTRESSSQIATEEFPFDFVGESENPASADGLSPMTSLKAKANEKPNAFSNLNTDEDMEEELFAFSQSTKSSSFIDKSDIKTTKPPTEPAIATRKRAIINVISDEDDGNEDDLFNFSQDRPSDSNQKAKKFRFHMPKPFQASNSANNDNNDMTSVQHNTSSQHLNNANPDDRRNDSSARNSSNKEESFSIRCKPKEIPLLIDTKCWLNDDWSSKYLKKEEENENSISKQFVDQEHQEWINSLKKGIIIRICSTDIVASNNKPKVPETNKIINFKKFIKNK